MELYMGEYSFLYVKAHNPDIPLIQPHHAWRPIPQMFLDSILNPDEFGQNEGYN